MEILFILLFVFVSYLLGSVPTAVWVGKAFYGVDVRDFGSGNAGATNTFRVLGIKAGLLVFLIDFAKGLTAASLVRFFGTIEPSSIRWVNIQLLFGVSAVMGHIFPIFAKFKGGKGVATYVGILFTINIYFGFIFIFTWLIIFALTRYSSLSSLVASFSIPIYLTVLTHFEQVFFFTIMFVLIFFTHRENIKRLRNNEESKTKIY